MHLRALEPVLRGHQRRRVVLPLHAFQDGLFRRQQLRQLRKLVHRDGRDQRIKPLPPAAGDHDHAVVAPLDLLDARLQPDVELRRKPVPERAPAFHRHVHVVQHTRNQDVEIEPLHRLADRHFLGITVALRRQDPVHREVEFRQVQTRQPVIDCHRRLGQHGRVRGLRCDQVPQPPRLGQELERLHRQWRPGPILHVIDHRRIVITRLSEPLQPDPVRLHPALYDHMLAGRVACPHLVESVARGKRERLSADPVFLFKNNCLMAGRLDELGRAQSCRPATDDSNLQPGHALTSLHRIFWCQQGGRKSTSGSTTRAALPHPAAIRITGASRAVSRLTSRKRGP